MATRSEPNRKGPKARQAFLPDMEPPRHKDLDAAAETYTERRDERCRLSAEEREAHDNLLEKMKEHGLDRYEFDGQVVTVLSKSKAAVKRKKDRSDDREDAEE